MRKIWTIAWKELYVRFTDRSLLVIMIAVPLAISSIVGLAFGGLGGSDISISDIPVAIVNHDAGSDLGVNYGRVFVDLLVPGSSSGDMSALPACETSGARSEDSSSLQELTQAVAFTPELAQSMIDQGELTLGPETGLGAQDGDALARLAVDQGIYTAAVIIPEDYSLNLASMFKPQGTPQRAEIEVYANAGQPIGSGVIYSIIDGISQQLATGNIAIAASIDVAASRLGPGVSSQMGNDALIESLSCAFSPSSNLVGLQTKSVSGESRSMAGIILVSVGSAQAMFFALFTAQGGVFSMHAERRQWTLQRLIMSPTSRSEILGGKLLGTFISVVVQLVLLMLALTLVGSLIEGHLVLIWGTNFASVALVLLSAALAVSGLGMLLAGLIQTPEQANVLGSVINIGLAVLGGAFGFQLPDQISSLSLLYWGRSAFETLATNSGDITLNVAVLAGQGILMFLIGLLLFNRRFEL
jgi:ABC-2 type transport system permease protein